MESEQEIHIAESGLTGPLALVTIPFAFTQDNLLRSDEFIKRAKDQGHELDLTGLEGLHRAGLLLPLYRVSDTPVVGRRLTVQWDGGMNPRGEAYQAAADGRLRDCAEEGYSIAWPYERPPGETDRRWWNGFLFSSWQLIDTHEALNDQAWLNFGVPNAERVLHAQNRRRRALALSALAARYLPSIIGRMSLRPGMKAKELYQFELDSDLAELLVLAGVRPEELRTFAKILLGKARSRDPLRDWLPLVRHTNYAAWSKLHGTPLDCLWHRIAAEVLLRAYEDLAATGSVPPLPDIAQHKVRHPLHDRIGRRASGADPLDESLGRFGLSPHPKVLLLVEGETELYHFPRLLVAFGLDRPDLVRVQRAKGSKVNPQLLARYAISPRLGKRYPDGSRQLAATPTALVIAMDPENLWETEEKRQRQRRAIRGAIREEVESQGGTIADDQLDVLVNIHVWGDHKYEFANFTDEELVDALAELAQGRDDVDRGSPAWCERVLSELATARSNHQDIDVVVGKMRVSKPDLAAVLYPVLVEICERELEADNPMTPVIKVMLEVQRLVNLLSGGSYVLPSVDNAAPAPTS